MRDLEGDSGPLGHPPPTLGEKMSGISHRNPAWMKDLAATENCASELLPQGQPSRLMSEGGWGEHFSWDLAEL